MRRACAAGFLLGVLGLLAQDAPAPGPHATLDSPAACRPCHPADAPTRWTAQRFQPCSAYCLTCHPPTDMAQHHTIGVALSRPPSSVLSLTSDGRLTCATCHRLSVPRYDQVRWRSESLYGRLFRRQAAYLTYHLVLRNDRGQLCRLCH